MDLQQGDLLESQNLEFINKYLSNYKKIWEIYLGNDGTNRLPKQNISSIENRRREKVSQHNYTCLESVICMKAILEIIDKKQINSFEINQLIEVYNLYMCFFAHIGRIRDNLIYSYKKVNDDEILLKEFKKPLESFYKERCVVLHNIKIPFTISKKGMNVSTIKSISKTTQKGNSKFELSWNDLLNIEKTEIKKYLKETFYGMAKVTNDAMGEILKPINRIVTKHNIQVKKLHIGHGTQNTFPSGSLDHTR